MSSINLFQRIGLCGHARSNCCNDCESYGHFDVHSDSVCLQIVFAVKFKRVFFKNQSHEVSQRMMLGSEVSTGNALHNIDKQH